METNNALYLKPVFRKNSNNKPEQKISRLSALLDKKELPQAENQFISNITMEQGKGDWQKWERYKELTKKYSCTLLYLYKIYQNGFYRRYAVFVKSVYFR